MRKFIIFGAGTLFVLFPTLAWAGVVTSREPIDTRGTPESIARWINDYTQKHRNDFCYRRKYQEDVQDIENERLAQQELCQYTPTSQVTNLIQNFLPISHHFEIDDIKGYIEAHLVSNNEDPANTGFIATLKGLIHRYSISDTETLRALCFPIHLLPYFRCPDGKTCLFCENTDCTFTFQQTIAGYQASGEDGSLPVDTLRMQVTDDSALHLLGNFLKAMDPNMNFLILTCGAELMTSQQMESYILEQGFNSKNHHIVYDNIAPCGDQWAQDNSKPGLVNGKPVSLASRHFRGDEWGYIEDRYRQDTQTTLSLAERGLIADAKLSPLYFEGGNMVIGGGKLLIGENEITRNMALGLTRDQVIKAFSVEFGGLPVSVLPQSSFHVDLDVAVLNSPTHERPVVVVADPTFRAKHFFKQVKEKKNFKSEVEAAEFLFNTIRPETLRSLEEEAKDDFAGLWYPEDPTVMFDKTLDFDAGAQAHAYLWKRTGYKDTIKALPSGIDIVNIPDLYTNIVVSQGVVYMPTYEYYPEQNKQAEQIYRSLGFDVQGIPADEVMAMQGGPRCNVETYRRSSGERPRN
ncbi:MAG: hypothetical protein A3D19_01125 [Deltaproteobacteria bacterium RIFCSPHIGHO2_02_FULL_38_15]|nr:MAG: hypothetical protein A3D19_01125 [Deltaproteobacteria bacterium RIFCSPHIGHO2_02_FULL_38_15]OGQ33240.1 MAG: hypothetical protein A3A72_00375 [Deltaproteobacteria bacterium RIFCSPLOWO2_01_FULL_38_9]OGQ63609.1 MAG: hypothetical protein A3G92_06575 [Deltaproteobacteria bacterium RIFCSPLOWO2_12_FULL_38_8]HBQ21898.1 hypothetical protein [Deltaproteobacteria bacterium]